MNKRTDKLHTLIDGIMSSNITIDGYKIDFYNMRKTSNGITMTLSITDDINIEEPKENNNTLLSKILDHAVKEKNKKNENCYIKSIKIKPGCRDKVVSMLKEACEKTWRSDIGCFNCNLDGECPRFDVCPDNYLARRAKELFVDISDYVEEEIEYI